MTLPNITASIAKSFFYLKEIPLLNSFIDDQTKLFTFIFFPRRFFLMSKIIENVSSWKGVSLQNHRYGGIEFRVNNQEIGHLHGSGLLDILFDLKTKTELLLLGQVEEHHVFKGTGWASIYLKGNSSFQEVIQLLQVSFLLKQQNHHANA